MGPRPKTRLLTLLAVGFIVRALAPAGYMPAASGSGLLFELCPDRLPAGFMLPNQQGAHSHHHHDRTQSDEQASSASADFCQLGHMLIAAAAVGESASVDAPFAGARFTPATPYPDVAPPTVLAFRPRGPPIT